MTRDRPNRHWASIEEAGILWGMKIMLLIYRALGRLAFRLFLYPVVTYYFFTGGSARRASLDYLRRVGAFFPDSGLSGSLWESYRHFIAFGEGMLEKIAVWLGRIDPQQVDFHNRPLLLRQLEEKRGAMLLGSHIGNLEICRALAHLRGHIHLNILVHTRHAAKFNSMLSKVDHSNKIELIQVTELNPAIAIKLQDKVQQGEFLVVVGDRIPVNSQGRTVTASFLGSPAEFPQGPYLLASLLGCPVYTLFSYPFEGRYHISLEPFAERIELPRQREPRHRDLSAWAGRYAKCLEHHCHKVPLQWFNFFPFWAPALLDGEGRE